MGLCVGLKNSDAFVTLDDYVLQDSEGVYLSVLSVPDKRKVIINNIVYRIRVNSNLKEGE